MQTYQIGDIVIVDCNAEMITEIKIAWNGKIEYVTQSGTPYWDGDLEDHTGYKGKILKPVNKPASILKVA